MSSDSARPSVVVTVWPESSGVSVDKILMQPPVDTRPGAATALTLRCPGSHPISETQRAMGGR